MTKCQRFDVEQITAGGWVNYSISLEVWSTENQIQSCCFFFVKEIQNHAINTHSCGNVSLCAFLHQ